MRATFMLAFVAMTATVAGAQAPDADKDAGGVPLAILDYEVSVEGNENLGSQIADILTARLSAADSIQLVERSKLGKILDEQKLKLMGLTDQQKAVKIGKLVGAKLMIMGKGFMMDKKLMLVTKLVGVETSLVKGSILTVTLDQPMSESIMKLSEQIAGLIDKSAAKVLPSGTKLPDPIEEIRKKLGKSPRPVVAIVVPEAHKVRRAASPRQLDPAVETEIKRILIELGFKVVDTGRNDLADWARQTLKGKDKPWPPALAKADVVVVGEAFSEFALRTGDLVTCAARAEINVIDRHSGRILCAERDTQRGVDLAEEIAGKTALQNAGHRLGLAVARALINYKKPAEKVSDKPARSGG